MMADQQQTLHKLIFELETRDGKLKGQDNLSKFVTDVVGQLKTLQGALDVGVSGKAFERTLFTIKESFYKLVEDFHRGGGQLDAALLDTAKSISLFFASASTTKGKGLGDFVQQMLYDLERVDGAIAALGVKETSSAKLKALESALQGLRQAIDIPMDPAVIANQFAHIFDLAEAAVKGRSPAFAARVRGVVEAAVASVRESNAGRELATVVRTLFSEAGKIQSLTISPVSLKSLKEDETGVKESFAAMGSYVRHLAGNLDIYQATLQRAFDPAQLSLFQTALLSLVPAFERLERNEASFGELFNSTTKAATDNLYALQTVMRMTGSGILKDADALKAQASAVETLESDLRIVQTVTTGLKKQNEIITTSTSNVDKLTRQVVDLFRELKRLPTGQMATKDQFGFDKTQKSVAATSELLSRLQQELYAVNNQATRSDGTSRFGANLELSISSAINQVEGLSGKIWRLQRVLEGVETTKIDKSLAESQKVFETFSKEATSSIQQVRTSINGLGAPTAFATVQSGLAGLVNSFRTVDSSVLSLTKLYDQFVADVRTNIPTLSVAGVKSTLADFETLIKTYREYVSAQLATATAKATPANPRAQEIKSYQDLIGLLNGLSRAVQDNGKEVTDQARIYNLLTTSVARAGDVAQQSQAKFSQAMAVGPTIAGAVSAYDTFVKSLGSSSVAVDKVVRSLEEMARTGATLPAALKNVTLDGVAYQISSLQELIDLLKKTSQGYVALGESANRQFGVSALATVQTELQRVVDLLPQATFPTRAGDAVALYSGALAQAKANLLQLANQATDFSTLQTVYSGHKKQLDSFLSSINQTLDALRRLGTAGVAEINLGGSLQSITQLTAAFETARATITSSMAEVNVGLQKGGASLDVLLKDTGRIKELGTEYTQLAARVTAAQQALATLTTTRGATASADSVKQLKTEVGELVAARQALLAEIKGAMERLDSAAATAMRTTGSSAALVGLDVALQSIRGQFQSLETQVGTLPATVGQLGSQLKALESAVAPIVRLNEALKQSESALQGTAGAVPGFVSTFNSGVQTLIADLMAASHQIGFMRTQFETQPREVLQSYMTDLKIKSDELLKSYIEITKSIHQAESAAAAGIQIPTGSLTDAQASAAALRKEIQNVEQAANVLREVMKRLPEGSGLVKVFDGISTSMQEVRESGALLSKGMKSLFTNILNRSGVDQTSPRFKQMVGELDQVTSAFSKLEDKMVTGLRNMDMMTMGLQMLGQAIVEPFKQGIEIFSQFEDTLTFIQGATGATSAQIDRLTKSAQLLGTVSRYGTAEAADGFKQLALAGYNVEQQMQSLPVVMQLATAAEMKLGDATEILVQVMSTQKLGIEAMGKATDIMAMGAIRTTATLTDMGTAFKYVGSIAGTMGNEVEDTSAAVALLHNAGMRGSMAGTALRGALQALLNPTRDEAKTIEDLGRRIGGAGLQITNAEGKFVGFVSLLEQFEAAGITTAEVLDLFGQRAGPGMAALLQLGSAQLKELKVDLGNAEGSTAKLATMMEQTLAGKLKILSNNFEVLGESIGSSLSKTLKPLADAATAVISKVMVIRDAMGGLTVVMDNVVAGLAALTLALGTAALGWSMMIVPTRQFFSFLGAGLTILVRGAAALVMFGKAMNGVAASSALLAVRNAANLKEIVNLTGGFMGLARGIGAVALALVNNPIGALLTVLVVGTGIVLAFAKNTEAIGAALDRQASMVRGTIKEFELLGVKIMDVANQIEFLKNKSGNISTDQFFNTQGVEQQRAKMVALLEELSTRFEESGNYIRSKMSLVKIFDPLTGELVGLKAISLETGAVIANLSVDLLKSGNAAQATRAEVEKLRGALNSAAELESSRIAGEKFANQIAKVRDSLVDLGEGRTQKALALMEGRFAALSQAQARYVAATKALDAAKASNDQQAVAQAVKTAEEAEAQLKAVFGSTMRSIYDVSDNLYSPEKVQDMLDGLFGNVQQYRERGAELNRDLSAVINQAIQTLKIKKMEVNVDNVMGELKQQFVAGFGPSWLPTTVKRWFALSPGDEQQIAALVGQSLTRIQQRAATAVQSGDAGQVLETGFRGMQRSMEQMVRAADGQIKAIGSKMEELNKVLDNYKKNVDVYTKYRDQMATASKAKMDVGIGAVQAQTEIALTQIRASQAATVAVGSDAFNQLAGAADTWGQKTTAVNTRVFQNFAKFKGQEVTLAARSSSEMYSYYRNSLEKQIDDLERVGQVTETVYTVPTQRSAARYVADAIQATSQLLQYTITFNDQLLASRVQMEQQKLAVIQAGLNKEQQLADTTYSALRPLYREGSEERIKLEENYLEKKKDLDKRGLSSTQAALDRIKELYKSNADKIAKVEADKQAFIDRANKGRSEIANQSLSDVQKLENDKERVVQLAQAAEREALLGHLDKSKALYEKTYSALEGLKFEPWDQQSADFATQMWDRAEKGAVGVSDKMKAAGMSQQQTLEQTAKGLEMVLGKFQENLGGVEQELTKLATAMESLSKSNAKDVGIEIDSQAALEKIQAVIEKKKELDRLFERPLPLMGTTEQITQDMQKVYADQKKLQGDQQTALAAKRGLEGLQAQSDELNNLLAAYRELSTVVDQLSVSRLPTGVDYKSKLEDVSKAGSEGEQKLKALNQALTDEETSLQKVSDAFNKLGRDAPAAIGTQISLIKEARASLVPDASGSVIINESVTKALRDSTELVGGLKTNLDALDTERMDGLTKANVEYRKSLVDIATEQESLSKQRIGSVSANATDLQPQTKRLKEQTDEMMKNQEAAKLLQQYQSQLGAAVSAVAPQLQPLTDVLQQVTVQSQQSAVAADQASAAFTAMPSVSVKVDEAQLNQAKDQLKEVQEVKPQVTVETTAASVDGLKTALAEVAATPVAVKVDSTEVEKAIEYAKQLTDYDGRRVTMQLVADLTRSTSGFQSGGLVSVLERFARGGLAQIRRFAAGGSTAFRRLNGTLVPGVGHRDTVPAMLTPGEYVVKRSAVERYGLRFMNALNAGVVQFRALGGAIQQLPATAVSGAQRFLLPEFSAPDFQLATDGDGPMVTVKLLVGDKAVMMKSRRDQVSELVSAAKHLNR